MIRRMLATLNLLGLILGVGLWVASIWGVGLYEKWRAPFYTVAWASRGSLHVTVIELQKPWPIGAVMARGVFVQFGGNYLLAPDATWHRFRIHPTPTGEVYLSVPLYIAIVSFGAWPAWRRFPGRLHRQREKLGLCIKCGYNLHGLTEPRCPECGTPFEMSNKSEAVSSKAESTQQDATP